MTWLAIDPSLRNTGYALATKGRVIRVGLICTEGNRAAKVYLDNARCLRYISLMLGALSDTYPWAPVYAEAKGGSKSAKAAAAMAMSQGVLMGSLTPRHEVTLMLPQEVKKRLTGNRSATKDDVRAAVDKIYPDAFEMMVAQGYKAKKYNEHIYDALAIGWAINERNG